MTNVSDANSFGPPDLQTVAGALCSLLRSVRDNSRESLWLTGSALRDGMLGLPIPAERDTDFVFFNEKEISKSYEKEIEAVLRERTGVENISVKNQARMMLAVEGLRCPDLFQSIASFPDVTIAMAARILDSVDNAVVFFIPYGLDAFAERTIRPTLPFLARHSLSGFYDWLDRKAYVDRFPNWQVTTNGSPWDETRLRIVAAVTPARVGSADRSLPQHTGLRQ